MTGYRESNFDLNTPPDYGRPLRPFNAWQWLGVAIIIAGIAVVVAAFASRFGWLPAEVGKWLAAGTSLCVIGALFVNSRRETLSPEETAKRRRGALIGAAIGLAICAVGAVILYFAGAF
ncbi:MAG: hypothetical protein ACJ8FF_02550 [Sphingomicrobium sp.]